VLVVLLLSLFADVCSSCTAVVVPLSLADDIINLLEVAKFVVVTGVLVVALALVLAAVVVVVVDSVVVGLVVVAAADVVVVGVLV